MSQSLGVPITPRLVLSIDFIAPNKEEAPLENETKGDQPSNVEVSQEEAVEAQDDTKASEEIKEDTKEFDLSRVIYIGDTKNDITAAKAAKVKSCGVLYIKNPEIMLECKPDYVVDNLSEVLKIVGE